MKAVRTDRELEMGGLDAALRARGVEVVLLPDGVPEEAIIRELRDADLLLMCYTPVSARIIASAPKLKGIVKYGVGIDAIDIPAARARGIPVVNVPAYAEQTVAEGAFALMLGLARRFKAIQHEMDASGWAWPTARWLGQDLSGATLGLVGVGRIGRSMARMAAAFRMRVLGFDPQLPADFPGERRENLVSMLAECNFVSIHCVLNAQTRHLVGAAQIAAMKPSAFLINVSRGEIVDEAALLAALQAKRIAGAALDVYGREPLARNGHPLSALYAMDNVILWPHLTFYTREAMHRLEEDTLARCVEILEGKPVLVKSSDPRLRVQTQGVRFPD
ncbi:MAG: C-terminal binding protein [Betaproteobacteria bacterium]|nr:C-terminal binding protein [Betaproteobacteria bacterium]